jgi:hypothetical protein
MFRASNGSIFNISVLKWCIVLNPCDTPVMTYFASYIVPIPESTSIRWCILCGAEGTTEEFFSRLKFEKSPFFLEKLV